MRSPKVLALDCGASRVCAAVFSSNAGGTLTLERFVCEPVSGEGDDHQWALSVGDAMRRLSGDPTLQGTVALVTPGHLSLTKFFRVPHVDEAKRRRIVQFEAQQNVPYPLNEVVWDYQVVAEDGVEFEVAISAIKLDVVEALCREASSAGRMPQQVEPSWAAQINAFRYNYPDLAETVLLINIGAKSSDLIFITPDRFFVRSIGLAGNAVTQSLAEELKISFSDAEELKRNILQGHVDPAGHAEGFAATERAVQSFVGKFSLEITRSVATYRRHGGSESPARIFLTGGGSLIGSLPALLGERIKVPTDWYEPLRRIEFGGGTDTASAADYAHQIGEAAGVALSLFGPVPAKLDLLPNRIKDARAFRKRQPFYLAAAAVLVASLGLPIFSQSAVIERRTQQIASVQSQGQPLNRLDQQIRSSLDSLQTVRSQIAGIKGLAESRSNWINFLSDLQNRLVAVEDVWLETLEVARIGPAQGQGGGNGLLGAPARAPGSGQAASNLRLTLSGRLIDRQNPVSRVSQESFDRVKNLLSSFVGSEYIVAVENERFDNTQEGILSFEFVLVVDPNRPL
jgi:type IV pilus assembly protein PilM